MIEKKIENVPELDVCKGHEFNVCKGCMHITSDWYCVEVGMRVRPSMPTAGCNSYKSTP